MPYDQFGRFMPGPEPDSVGLGQGNLNEAPGPEMQGPPAPQPSADPMSAALNSLGEFGHSLAGNLAEEAKPKATPKFTIQDGNVTIGGLPLDTFQAVLGGFQQHQQTQAAFNAEALRLQQQENQIRQNPILHILATLGAAAGQAPNMPGVTQMLGRASAALNPSPDTLAQRRLGIMQTLAELEQQQAGHENAARAQYLQAQQQQISNYYRQQELDLRKQAFTASMEKKDADAYQKWVAPYEKDANNDKVPRLIDHDKFVTEFIKQEHGDLKDAEDQYGRLKELYDATVAGKAQAARDAANAKALAIQVTAAPAAAAAAQKEAAVRPEKAATASALNEIKNQKAVELKETLLNRGIPEKEAEQRTKGKGAAQITNDLLKEKGVVTPQEHKILDESFSTDQLLDRTERLLADPVFQKVSGPWFSVDPKTKQVKVNTQAILPKWLKGAERTQYESQLSHELPRILNVINPNGATSLLRSPEGWKRIEALGAQPNQRPDQIAAILDVIRGANNDRRGAIVGRKTNVEWVKDPGNSLLIGLAHPKNNAYFLQGIDWKGKMATGPIIKQAAPAASGGKRVRWVPDGKGGLMEAQ